MEQSCYLYITPCETTRQNMDHRFTLYFVHSVFFGLVAYIARKLQCCRKCFRRFQMLQTNTVIRHVSLYAIVHKKKNNNTSTLVWTVWISPFNVHVWLRNIYENLISYNSRNTYFFFALQWLFISPKCATERT